MEEVKRKPKVFILGISGFLGFNIAIRLRRDFYVCGAYLQNQVIIPGTQIFPIDPLKQELLEPIIRVQEPDLIVNALGIYDRATIEKFPKLSEALNVGMAVSMAALAAKLRSKFIQLSCSEIYDGADGNYKEDDMDYTMYNELGKQKLAAESYIRTQTLESTILRIGKVIGLSHPFRLSTFDKFRREIRKGLKVESSKALTHSFLSTESLASAVKAVLQGEFPGKHRIFNVGGPTMTEYEIRKGWAELVEGNGNLVISSSEEKKRDVSIQSENFKSTYPQWEQETREKLYLNLLNELSPGVGAKRWQKTLQIP